MTEPSGEQRSSEEIEAARKRVDGMPAETALGHEDAAGGHDETPAEYRNVQNDPKTD